MPKVTCGMCQAEVVVWPLPPLRVIRDERGQQVIPTDYAPVFEHMRDVHPETWTDELATAFEQWKKDHKL